MSAETYRFPLFIDLTGRRVVVVGAGHIAARRIGVLLAFGAEVCVIAPEAVCPLPDGVTWQKRPYAPGDLEGAFLAVAAANVREVNRAVGEEAAARGIFASIADSKTESTFFFPAICQGSGLVAGVVSGGEEHHKTARAARAIREVLEDMK